MAVATQDSIQKISRTCKGDNIDVRVQPQSLQQFWLFETLIKTIFAGHFLTMQEYYAKNELFDSIN